MRTLIGITLFLITLVIACGEYQVGYNAGMEAGWTATSDKIAESIRGLKEVQAIREQSEFDRGKASCH